MAERAILVGGALFTISGTISVFGIASYGLLKTNTDLIETSSVVSQYNFGISKNIYEVIFHNKISSNIELGLNAFLSGVGFVGLSELKKKTEQINLYAGIHHQLSKDKQQKYLNKINDIPKNYQHLLSHLSSKELIMFIESDDEDRKRILQKNKPSLKQRYLSVLSSDDKLLRAWAKRLKVAGTVWDSSFSMKGSLGDAVKHMRKNKDKKNPGQITGLALN